MEFWVRVELWQNSRRDREYFSKKEEQNREARQGRAVTSVHTGCRRLFATSSRADREKTRHPYVIVFIRFYLTNKIN